MSGLPPPGMGHVDPRTRTDRRCANPRGLAIAAYGLRSGIHLGLAVTVVLSAVTLGVVSRVNIPVTTDPVPTHMVRPAGGPGAWDGKALQRRRSLPACAC